MATDGARAHEAAVAWWRSDTSARARSRGFGICDRCNVQIPVGQGNLCSPAIIAISGAPGGFDSPDLICDSCFARHPSEPWVSQQPEVPARGKKWWEVWK
jgi:hypothetical protein